MEPIKLQEPKQDMQANLLLSPPYHPFNSPSNFSSRNLSISDQPPPSPSTPLTAKPKAPPPTSPEKKMTKNSHKNQSPPSTSDISRKDEQQQQQMPVSKLKPPLSLAEKAAGVVCGGKGLLFWLNKFAYASIFIIIGGWIVFRFVGPSLGFYELDAPPLSPTSILRG